MSTQMLYLLLVTALTGLLWIPYILDRIAVRGLMEGIGYPEHPKPQSPWAQRLMAAHENAVENLVVFAPLVLAAQSLNIVNETIGAACVVYFWARLAHVIGFTFKIFGVRTLSFAIGFFAQAAIAWQLLV